MSWLTGYTHRKKITVQTANLDAGLTDFPLYVHIDADADIGALCLATGYDIRFTAIDGSTELPYDRESFAVAVGEAMGDFWVKSNLATSPATEIYVYYGDADAEDGNNPTAVWGAPFQAVWHMAEAAGGSGAILDSTGNSNDLTDAGSPVFGEAGPYNKSIFIDATDAFLEVSDSPSLSLNGSFTFLAWIKVATYGLSHYILCKQPEEGSGNNYPGNYQFNIDEYSHKPKLMFEYSSGNFESHLGSTALTDATWQRVAVVVDSLNTITFYIDGATAGSDATSHAPATNSQSLLIGKRRDNDTYFGGWMADLRIVSSALSAAWIKFEHANVAEADHELTWGDAETAPVTATPLELELAKATKELAYLLEIELGHRIDTDAWTQCDAPNTAVFWMDHLAEGEPSRVKECNRSAHTIAEYTFAADVAACQATASSWFYDSATGRLYVHTSGGDSPSTTGAYYLMALFWERFCDGQYEGAEAIYYNSTWYLPYLDESSIPDVSLEVSMFSEGGIRQSFGTIHLINTDGHFDQRVADYIYCGKKAVLQVGVPGSTLAEFVTIWRGWTGNWECTDERLSISTEDERKIAE